MPSAVTDPDRKRRAHAKSRKGCGNCKLRRVKCDETRPQCAKCLSYGVSCNYDAKKSSLDLSAQGVFQIDLSQKPSSCTALKAGPAVQFPLLSQNKSIVAMINESLNSQSDGFVGIFPGRSHWVFSEGDLKIWQRFQDRTVMTVGTSRTASAYRKFIADLAFRQSFLMHMVLCLTLLHDADLIRKEDPSAAAKATYTAIQHWSTATVLYNRTLSRPIQNSAKDPLWATAALIGCCVFAYVDSSDVEETWPLKTSGPNDLDWLKLSDGKKAVWSLVDPSRPDSLFRAIANEHFHISVPNWVEQNDISALPEDMKRLFDIGPFSNIQNNVYHLPALILSQLQFMKPDHDNVLNFLYFMGYMTPEFRNLLEIKDPRALLLLGWWFKKLENGDLWWLKRRAAIEGEAVRIWLERWFGGEQGLKEMFDMLGKTIPREKVSWNCTIPQKCWFTTWAEKCAA